MRRIRNESSVYMSKAVPHIYIYIYIYIYMSVPWLCRPRKDRFFFIVAFIPIYVLYIFLYISYIFLYIFLYIPIKTYTKCNLCKLVLARGRAPACKICILCMLLYEYIGIYRKYIGIYIYIPIYSYIYLLLYTNMQQYTNIHIQP